MSLRFSSLSRGAGGPQVCMLPLLSPVHEDYMEESSKSPTQVSTRDISMLNNSPRHPEISIECRVAHTFQGLVRAEARGTKERDSGWQVHSAVKAPLFTSQTNSGCHSVSVIGPSDSRDTQSLFLTVLRSAEAAIWT